MASILGDFSTNLVEHWKLDETSGNRTGAYASKVLTDVNTVGAGTGKQDGCADFERNNAEYLTIADGLSSLDNDFTISFWIKPETVPASSIGIFQFFSWYRESGTESYFASLMIDYFASAKKLQILIEGATNVEDYYNHSMTAGNWYHVALVGDLGTGYALYINGSSVKTGTCPTKKTSSPGYASPFFEIGESHAQNDTRYARYYDGLMDEVTIWDRALSSSDISTIYNSGDGIPYAATASGPASLKTRDTIAKASVKTIDGIAIASVKSINTIT